MEYKLKPCPFCGGEAEIAEYIDRTWMPYTRKAKVQCMKCNASSRVFTQRGVSLPDFDEAVKAWNRRGKNG